MMDQVDEMDRVFKALADQSRRLLLDLLFQRDGQTLLELQQNLPMTRFGCMKHLKVLEEAGLVTSRKVGREKFHYLNPVPIQQIQERWVSKYSESWTQRLLGLKFTLEDNTMDQKKPAHVYEVFIRTTPERLWQAITDGELTQKYFYNYRVESTWRPGASYAYHDPEGKVGLSGEVVESDPPRRLVTTFSPAWASEVASSSPSRVTWEITPVGETCKLTLVHDDIDPEIFAAGGLHDGWLQVVSSLKTLLETGQPLVFQVS